MASHAPFSPAASDPLSRATLMPFRALRYGLERPELDPGALISPPGKELDAAGGPLSARPYHILNLFPEKEAAPDSRALGAAQGDILRGWLKAGIMQVDTTPGLFLHSLTRMTPSGPQTRLGLFALLALEPQGPVEVLRHEHTVPHKLPRQVQLLVGQSAQLQPVSLMYNDPADRLMTAMQEHASQSPLLDTVDSLGHRHSLQRLHETATPLANQLLHGQELIIMDGHHRYDALRQLWLQTPHTRPPDLDPAAPGQAWVLAWLTNAAAPGFGCDAIHRVVRGLPGSWNEAVSRLEPLYLRQRIPLESQADRRVTAILEGLSQASGTAFALLGKGEDHWDLITRRLEVPQPSLDALPPALADLEVSRLHAEVLPCLMSGAETSRADFEKDPRKAVAAVLSGAVDVACLLRPPSLAQIQAVARGGLAMPPKATYFTPKLPAGLLGMRLMP